MRSDGCSDSAKTEDVAARNSATAGVDMRVALTYCLLKIPAKIGNPSCSLPSKLDEAAITLDISVGGLKILERSSLCVMRGN